MPDAASIVELALIAGATLVGLALLAWILTRARAEAQRPGSAGSQAAEALRGGAPGRDHAPAEPALGDTADLFHRLGGPLSGGQHRPRGRRRLVRRRAATRRDRARERRRRRRARRRGSGAHGPVAQRVPRVCLRPRLSGGDHVAPHAARGRGRDGHSHLHHDRSVLRAARLLLGRPPAAAPTRRRFRCDRAARSRSGATARLRTSRSSHRGAAFR